MQTVRPFSGKPLRRDSPLELFLSLVPGPLRADLVRFNKKPSADIATVYKRAAASAADVHLQGCNRNLILACRYFHHPSVSVALEETDSLYTIFCSTIAVTKSIHAFSSRFLEMNALFYLLVLVRYPHQSNVTFVMENTFPSEELVARVLDSNGIGYNQFYMDVLNFLSAFQAEMVAFATDSRTKFTEAVYDMFLKIYKVLCRDAVSENETRNPMYKDFYYMVSFMPDSHRCRLLLMSFMYLSKEQFFHLHELRVPNLYLVATVEKFGRPIPFGFWFHMCSAVLNQSEEWAIDLIEKHAPVGLARFVAVVYELDRLHLSQDSRARYAALMGIRRVREELLRGKVDAPTSRRTLLMQYLALQFPNYVEIWYKMGWAFHSVAMRRVCYFAAAEFARRSDAVVKFDPRFNLRIIFA